MKCFVEMQTAVAMMLVMATQAVAPGCYVFCQSICILPHQSLAQQRPDCNCLDLNKSELEAPTLVHLNSGIYYEPAELYPYQNVLLTDQPIYVLNPITVAGRKIMMSQNKIRGRDAIIKGTLSHIEAQEKTDRKLSQIYKRKRRNESNKLSIYLDIDILQTTDAERAYVQKVIKSEIEDLRLVEYDLSECIYLHLLINSRKNGNTIYINTDLNSIKIRQFEKFTDADLRIEIEKKCIQTANIVRKSLYNIKKSWPKKMFSSVKFNNTVMKDNSSNKTSMQRHAINISSQSDFKPVENASDDNTANSQYTSFYTNSISRSVNNEPHNINEEKKQMINIEQEENYNKYLLNMNTKATVLSDQITVNYTNNNITSSASASYEKSPEIKVSFTVKDISSYNYPQSTDYTTSADKLIPENPIIYFENDGNSSTSIKRHDHHILKDGGYHNNDYNTSVHKNEYRPLVNVSHVLSPISEINTKDLFTESVITRMTHLNSDYIEEPYHSESDIIENHDKKTYYSDQNIGILKRQNGSQIIFVNVSNEVGSTASNDEASAVTLNETKTNDSAYLEVDIQIPRIITKEYSNDTVTSTISGNELLPNFDFNKDDDNIEQMMDYVTRKSDRRQFHRQASTSAFTDSLENLKINILRDTKFLQRNNTEISGILYFLFDKQKVPARFVQKADRKLAIGIDGFSLCNDQTQKHENKSVLLTTLCK